MPNITKLPAPRVDFIDSRTGLMAREWYRFFINLYDLVGNGSNDISLEDLQLSPVSEAFNLPSDDVSPSLPQLGTVSSYNLDSSGQLGSVIYSTGPSLSSTAVGTSGQVLTSQGSDVPVWDTPTVYLEGTWTPVFTGSSSNPSVTYTSQIGEYVRIGNLVQASGLIEWSAFSGGAGSLLMSLPLPVTGTSESGGLISEFDGVTFPGTETFAAISTIASTSTSSIIAMESGATSTVIVVGDISATGKISFNVTYSTTP